MDEILKCGQWKLSTEQYFPVKLFITLYKVDVTFEARMKSYNATIFI